MASKKIYNVSKAYLISSTQHRRGGIVFTKTSVCRSGVGHRSMASQTVPSIVVFDSPMSTQWNYFEIEILNSGEFREIGIGLGPLDYNTQWMPGWGDNSIGYHADDGRLFVSTLVSTRRGPVYGPDCCKGDTMGCGVDFNNQEPGYVTVWFTKNGELAGPPEKFSCRRNELYPLIGLSSLNESVRYTGHSCVSPPYKEELQDTYDDCFKPAQMCQRRVLYPYNAALHDELTLKPDDIIDVDEELGDWWKGRIENRVTDYWGPCSPSSGLFYNKFTVPHNPNEDKMIEQQFYKEPREAVGHPVTYLDCDYHTECFPDEDFECFICRNLSSDPQRTRCCSHIICYNCADKWRRTKNSCPACRKVPLVLVEDVRTKRLILNLIVYCPNYTKWCWWRGNLSSARDHLLHSCQYEVVRCEHRGCTDRMERRRLQKHMQDRCRHRPVICPCCRAGEGQATDRRKQDEGMLMGIFKAVSSYFKPGFTYEHLVTIHYKECQDWPMRCPNQCDTEESLTRATLRHHIDNICPEQYISCEFAEAGCTVRVKRREMADHIQNAVGRHMTAMMKDYAQVKKELKQLKTEHAELKREHKSLQDRASKHLPKNTFAEYFFNQ